MPEARDLRAVVTGYGLQTGLGNNALQSAALVRAGINRFAAWEAFGRYVEGAPALSACTLRPRLSDASWIMKAERLLQLPLYEAVWCAGLSDPGTLARLRVGAYVALPRRDRAGTDTDAYDLFIADVGRWLENVLTPSRVRFFQHEQAAGLMAISAAARDLRAGTQDVALIAGVDSALHRPYLDQLYSEGRLKTASTSDGLIPGEAGAVLVMERATDARRRGAPVLATFGEVAMATDPVPTIADVPVRGDGLARVLLEALKGEPLTELGAVYVDLTGERWRFLEWAIAEARSLSQLPRSYELWHPADCIGDTGATAAVALVVLAMRAFVRGYSGGNLALIATTGDNGQRAAMVVRAPESGEQR